MPNLDPQNNDGFEHANTNTNAPIESREIVESKVKAALIAIRTEQLLEEPSEEFKLLKIKAEAAMREAVLEEFGGKTILGKLAKLSQAMDQIIPMIEEHEGEETANEIRSDIGSLVSQVDQLVSEKEGKVSEAMDEALNNPQSSDEARKEAFAKACSEFYLDEPDTKLSDQIESLIYYSPNIEIIDTELLDRVQENLSQKEEQVRHALVLAFPLIVERALVDGIDIAVSQEGRYTAIREYFGTRDKLFNHLLSQQALGNELLDSFVTGFEELEATSSDSDSSPMASVLKKIMNSEIRTELQEAKRKLITELCDKVFPQQES